MPQPRYTIPKTVWGKLATQTNKPENADLKAMMAAAKKTLSPGGDTILWDPPKEFMVRMKAQLEREESFTRKRGSCSHKLLLDTIATVTSAVAQ